MLLSFIIPLYNGASSIGSCLDSILGFGMSPNDFEIIVINDGSKDESACVVEKYVEEHPQIKLFNQPNRGASAARNLGLDVAKGEFVWFVDADDMVLLDTDPISLIHQFQGAELIAFNYIRQDSSKKEKIIIFNENKQLTGLEMMKTYNLYLWNKLFRRSTIGEVRFVNGTVNQEDMYFCLQVLVKTKNVQGINRTGYLYDCTSNTSTTRSSGLRRYVKNYQDSVLIQGSIKRMADAMTDKQIKAQLMEIDNFCVINHFYIILRWYGYNRLKRAVKDYGALGLYPLGKCAFLRQNLFRIFANVRWLLLLSGFILYTCNRKKS